MIKPNFPIRVVIADDHILFRDGLKQTLQKTGDIQVVGEASNGQSLIKLAMELDPEVVMSDLRMPLVDGIEAIRKIKTYRKSIKCLIFSTFNDDTLIFDALEAGALGYINKNSDREDMLNAVYTVWQDNEYFCSSTNFKLAKKLAKSKYYPYQNLQGIHFSEKELQIIALMCKDKKNEEIGKILFMSTRTIEGYRSRLLEKLNANTSIGIVLYAIKNNLCDYGS